MITLQKLTEKVERRISDYIEFDVNEIFKLSDYITIFGGSVRDSIADLDIHDIDILCMPDSARKLKKYLEDNHNYTSLELYDIDTLNMYHGITLISEPWTLINDNKKIIQIIRPRFYLNKMTNREQEYIEAYQKIIKNVDISCCGVFFEFNGRENVLKEACKNAIVHCLSKTFEVNEWSILYNTNRANFRTHKLTSRGWYNIDDDYIYDKKEHLTKQRLIKLTQIEFKPIEDYKIWTENEIKKAKIKKGNDYPF